MTWTDEMFATPLTAALATRVKSGPAATTGGCGRCASAGAAIGAAGSTLGRWGSRWCVGGRMRVRLVIVSPAANPATIRSDREPRTASRHVHPPRAAAARLWNRDREQPVLEVGGDRLDVDRLGQHERPREAAVAALDAMVLLAGHLAAALAANDDAALLGVDLDVVACESRKLRGQDEGPAGLVQSTGGVQPGASVPTS